MKSLLLSISYLFYFIFNYFVENYAALFNQHPCCAFSREWKVMTGLPQPRRRHGCGAYQDRQNETVLVIFGGLSGKTEFLSDILVLSLDDLSPQWRQFESSTLPYSNIILKSLVLYLDDKRCELMFAGVDGIYVCKKNFQWTVKPLFISDQYKLTWSGIARLKGCWNESFYNPILNF